MKKSEMLNCLIDHYTNGNKAKFAQLIDVRPQTINTWLSRDTFDVDKIFAKCEGVSGDWLLSDGEGEMLLKKRFVSDSNINTELIELCKQLVSNYQQREEVMSKLVSLMK